MVSTERGSPTDRATSHSVRARSGIAHRSAQSENRTTVASVPAFTTVDSRAGEAWTTFLAIEEVAGRSVDDSAVEDPRVAACVDFAEQFVVDVSGMTDDQRAAMTSAMGADAFLFVQTLFVTDVFTRGRIAIARLFADSAVHALSGVGSTKIAPGDDGVDLWALLERFMQQVALLDALDPLTTDSSATPRRSRSCSTSSATRPTRSLSHSVRMHRSSLTVSSSTTSMPMAMSLPMTT
jgi:hypothetical protein